MKLLQDNISFNLLPQTTFTSSFTILCEASLYLYIDMCIYMTNIDQATNGLLESDIMFSASLGDTGVPT